MSAEILNSLIQRLDSIHLDNGTPLTDMHKLRGISYGQVLDINNQPYDDEPGRDLRDEDDGGLEEWVDKGRVLAHSLMTSIVTDVLGEALNLSPERRVILNISAFMHDSDKRRERIWQRSIERFSSDLNVNEVFVGPDNKQIIFSSQDTLITAQKEKALQDAAANEEFENAQAGFPVEISRLMRANNPKSPDDHPTLEEKIMWFADACLTGTEIVPVDERMDRSAHHPKNGAKNIAISESYRPKFGGKSLFEVQKELGARYEKEFSNQIDLGGRNFYDWLREKVDRRVTDGQLPIFGTK